MKKGSIMGTSKYEFNPEQFDNDMIQHQIDYIVRRNYFEEILRGLIIEDVYNAKERYYLIIDVLKEIRADYI